MYNYAWYHWITFFFLYCFLGWIFESAYVSLKKRKPVNRGFLRLPMLPLYGFGAIMMLWVSLPVQDNIILVYLSGVLGATILEYVTGYVMERLFRIKYWDYSSQKYNLHGYICLSSSIAWGFLTLFMTDVIHKPIERFVLALPPLAEFAFITVVGLLFAADTVQSTREALNLAKALEAMTKMKADLESMQVQMALLKAEIAQRVEEYKDGHPSYSELSAETHARLAELSELKDHVKDNTKAAISELKSETEAALTARIDSLNLRLDALAQKRSELKQHMGFYRKGILKGNPSATSERFAEALKELRESLKK